MIKLITNNIIKYIILTILFSGLSLITFKQCNKRFIVQDNYDSIIHGTSFKTLVNGQLASTAYVMSLSNRQIKHSKDSTIIKLIEQTKLMDIKLRKTKTLLAAALKASGQGKVIVYYDTIYLKDTIEIFQKDTFDNGYLTIYRSMPVNSNEALYKYIYNLDIYANVNKFKIGKWKIINLFKWRRKKYKIDITTSDTNMIVKDIKYIEVK